MLLYEAVGVLFEPITDRLKAVEGRLTFIEGRINALIRMERRDARRDRMANQALDRLTKEMTENRDAVASIETLVSGLAEQIRNASSDPEALNKLADDLDANTNRLVKAVTDNTPFNPSAQ